MGEGEELKPIEIDGKIYHVLWKNQCGQKKDTTQGNLQIQCNPYQIINGIFQRTKIFIIV